MRRRNGRGDARRAAAGTRLSSSRPIRGRNRQARLRRRLRKASRSDSVSWTATRRCAFPRDSGSLTASWAAAPSQGRSFLVGGRARNRQINAPPADLRIPRPAIQDSLRDGRGVGASAQDARGQAWRRKRHILCTRRNGPGRHSVRRRKRQAGHHDHRFDPDALRHGPEFLTRLRRSGQRVHDGAHEALQDKRHYGSSHRTCQ